MILGNQKKIDLSTSSFEAMREENNLYIDKTIFIEHFLNESNSVQLIVRQRRLGKSLNLDMLRCFLTNKIDCRGLFEGTYIRNSEVWPQANSAPVFYFDFKNLGRETYKTEIKKQVLKHIYDSVDVSSLSGFSKFSFESYLNGDVNDATGLLVLTEIIHETTGKKSYILIDEYDKLLTDNYNNKAYESIKEYETSLLSAGLKGNLYLKKALMTGVMRVSRESMLSGLNNLYTYDLFSDDVFAADFGLTEEEIDGLQKLYGFNKDLMKKWYDGIKINKVELYNIYSVISCIRSGIYKNYWGRSGTISIILNLLNEERENIIIRLLNGETVSAYVNERISLHELAADPGDGLFYSLLVQSGYLAVEDFDVNNGAIIKIPSKELMTVWKEFILTSFVKSEGVMRSLFANINDAAKFSEDIEYFLSDRLSYFDIAESEGKTAERIYHVFMLGLLSAYEDISYHKPLSNRESGGGRYDILFERKEFNVIFEFKSAEEASRLESAANDGLKQIDEKRYFADIRNDKPLMKTSVAFCGKRCSVKSAIHEWLPNFIF